MQGVAARRDLEVRDIAIDHCEIFVLAATMKSEPEPEAIRQRNLFFDGLAGIDGS